MSQPYVGEIRMFGGNFAPAGWAFCNGGVMAIAENEQLFNLIGTTYGGDGQSTFALPNLQGQLPVHQGNGRTLGEKFGVEAVTMNDSQLPLHSHQVAASAAGASQSSPGGNLLANTTAAPAAKLYKPPSSSTGALKPGLVTSVGDNQPHDNMMPFLAVSFIISLFGVFPAQT
jgi:microcystin-dependent protein